MNNQVTNVKQQNNRLYLDIVKGIAIFLMLWGHCVQCCSNGEFDIFENFVIKITDSFHMPLFMLVSGYLFFFSCSKRSLSELIIHRTQSLLQPIIMCNIFNYFLTVAISLRTLSAIVDGPWINSFSALWFLWSVLSSSIAVGIAAKISKNAFMELVLICIGFATVYLYPNSTFNLYMYPYFAAGFLYAKYRHLIPSKAFCIKYVIAALFPFLLVFYKKEHYIYTTGIIPSGSIIEQLKIDIFRWVIGFVGSIFMLVLIELLFKHISAKKLFNPFARLGKYSLQVYCISVSVLSYWLPKVYGSICSKLGYNFLLKNLILYNYLFTPIIALIYAVSIYFLVKLLYRLKIGRILFGR